MQWAAQLADVFPVVFDTKVVCVLPELLGIFGAGTSLGQVHEVAVSAAANAFVELPPPPPAPAPPTPAPDAADLGGGLVEVPLPVAGSKRARIEEGLEVAACPNPVGDTPAVPATRSADVAASSRRASGVGGRPQRADRVQFSVDVGSLLDIRVADGFGFHTPAASSSIAASAVTDLDSAASVAATAAGLTPSSAEATAAAAEGAAHDAGADAYMTGVAFLRMAALLTAGAKGAAITQAPMLAAASPLPADRTSRDAPRAALPQLRLPRVTASDVAAVIRSAASSSPPASDPDAPAGAVALARTADSLFLMRISAPDHRVLRLRDGENNTLG